MRKNITNAYRVDVHKRFIDATILTSDETKKYRRFLTNTEGLLAFKDWLMEKDGETKIKTSKIPKENVSNAEDMIKMLSEAGYVISKLF